MEPFARGKTSSLQNVVAANSPRWDENRNRGKDEATESRGELANSNTMKCLSFDSRGDGCAL